MVTADTIISYLENAVASKKQMNPGFYLETALKLNILLGEEHEKLESLRRMVADKKLEILRKQEKRNVAAAEIEIETMECYQEMRNQEHKVDRIEEFIRLAKLQSKTELGY